MIDIRLIAITDSSICRNNFYNRLAELCTIGIPAIQLRENHLPVKEILLTSNFIKKSCNKHHHTRLIINDRLDLALISEADGMHCPENGFSGSQLKSFADKLIKGKSVHSLKSAVKASNEGFDYIIAGPICETPSKLKYGKPLGLKVLKEITLNTNIPVFAVGGVTMKNAVECIDNGAYGIAGIREFMTEKNLIKTFEYYRRLLDI